MDEQAPSVRQATIRLPVEASALSGAFTWVRCHSGAFASSGQ
jgi:hypothetical protein